MNAISDLALPAPTSEPTVLDVDAPAHVPRSLIRDLRVAMGYVVNSLDEPYTATERLLADDVPPVMWSPFPFTHITTGHWVVTRYNDIAKVYQDADLFSTEKAAAFQLLVGKPGHRFRSASIRLTTDYIVAS